MNSVDKEMKKRRNKKAKNLKKLRRARDWASPFINRNLMLKEIKKRYNKETLPLLAKWIALQIIDEEDMRRNKPRPPSPPAQPATRKTSIEKQSLTQRP